MSGCRVFAFDDPPMVVVFGGLRGSSRAGQLKDIGFGKTVYGRLGQTRQPVDFLSKFQGKMEKLGHHGDAGNEE